MTWSLLLIAAIVLWLKMAGELRPDNFDAKFSGVKKEKKKIAL